MRLPFLLDDMPHSVFAAQLLLPEEPLVIKVLVSREAAGWNDDHFPAGDVIAHHLNYAVPRYVREVVVAQVLERKKERKKVINTKYPISSFSSP